MKINITQEIIDSWAAGPPPEKTIKVTHAGIKGLTVSREKSGAIIFSNRYESPVTGSRKYYPLGKHPLVEWDQVQIDALKFQKRLANGEDPGLSGPADPTVTLKQAVTGRVEYANALFHRKEGRKGLSDKTAKDYMGILERQLGGIADLPLAHVVKHPETGFQLLAEIRKAGLDRTADITRNVLSTTVSWAMSDRGGLLSPGVNPFLVYTYKEKENETFDKSKIRYMDIPELGFFLNWLDKQVWGATVVTKIQAFLSRAMVLLMLMTGQRGIEVAAAMREEIDLATGLWSIPGYKRYEWNGGPWIRGTKNHLPIKFYLPRQALDLVEQVYDIVGKWSPWVFPTRKYSADTVSPHMWTPKGILERAHKAMLKDEGMAKLVDPRNITPHTTRKTFATHVEKSEGIKIVEDIENRVPEGVSKRHYIARRSPEEMGEALQRWANRLDRIRDGSEKKVIEFERKVG